MLRSTAVRFLFATVALSLSACTHPSSAWWTYQADARRTGVGGGMGRNVNPFWQVSLVGVGRSLTPPVFGAIGDTFRVFIASGYGDGRVFALSPYSGATQWTFSAAPGNGFFGAPAAADTAVYIASKGTTPFVYALNQRTGAVQWQTALPATGSGASVAVAQGRVFVNTDQHILYALNRYTGAIMWQVNTSPGPTSQESSPSVHGNRVYLGSDDGLFAFDIANGAQVWKYNLTAGVGFSSAVIDTVPPARIYIGTNDMKLHAVDPANGANVWTYSATATMAFHTVAAAFGAVYLFDFGNVVALDRSNAAVVWTQPSGTTPRHSPVLAGRTLFFHDDQELTRLDASNGAIVWKAPIPGNGDPTSPGNGMAIALEILLVPNKGTVYAFR
jgi:outer membrane protein assembly factor BamB